MRLWHYKLISALPTKQLVSQWRELWAILGNIKKYGNPHHVLVNKIMNYHCVHLSHYADSVYEEMIKRGYKPKRSFEDFQDVLVEVYPDVETKDKYCGGVFKGWHNYRYFVQCYYNLEEKYDCGGITDEEWDTLLDYVFKNLSDEFIKIFEG